MPEQKIEMFSDTEFEHCMPVAATEAEIAAMVDGDEVLFSGPEKVDIEYSYPLNGKHILEVFHPNGKTVWTRKDLFTAIQTGYYRIYEAEDAALEKEEEGPYGIWGHDIGDLVIELVRRMPSGKIKLSVGS